ncbi:MAG: conserved rane protein of unknown function [Hyphomicrobiales bacterium]|nr:conserved rane protein of unknown function [Hyphomicrobiales bacterium]
MTEDATRNSYRRGHLRRVQHFFLKARVTRPLAARPRLFFSFLAGFATAFLLPAEWRAATSMLIGWNVGTILYVLLAGFMILRADHETMTRRARTQDDGRFVMLTLSIIAAVASIGAIVAELGATKSMDGVEKGLHIGLAVLTIVSAWTYIHLTFALHYAHEYASERRRREDCEPKLRGGLDFPDTVTPSYGDFLYFSYVIGVASQTADVMVCSPMMRRIVLVHGVVSFFFNTTILALTINIAAGLI